MKTILLLFIFYSLTSQQPKPDENHRGSSVLIRFKINEIFFLFYKDWKSKSVGEYSDADFEMLYEEWERYLLSIVNC